MSLPVPTEAVIQQVVDLVVSEIHPLQVVLFGSAARGEQRADSDVDLMVVMPDGTECRQVSKALHVALGTAMLDQRLPLVAVDFVVATPLILAEHGDSPGLVYRSIQQEGRQLYAA